jgi:hypothetical protein
MALGMHLDLAGFSRAACFAAAFANFFNVHFCA